MKKNTKQLVKQVKEISNLKKIVSSIKLKKEDQFVFDFTDIDNKDYHDGIKFTFFA